jgi:tRNA-2-methylthio-N6-dimethylallyladenosine synthase
VGFPGETKTDFEETLDLIQTVEFDGLFAFKYSDRPNAAAARLLNKIPEQEKKERLQQVLDLQDRYTTRKNKALEGSLQSILVEGVSRKQNRMDTLNRHPDVQWTGRTSTNKIVNFNRNNGDITQIDIVPGQMVNVRILKAFSHSLWGEPVGPEPISVGSRGDESYVA